MPTVSPKPPAFDTVSQLLRDADARLASIDSEAEKKLHFARDLEGYQAANRRQTELFAGLPSELGVFKQAGGVVPEEVEDAITFYGAEATRALQAGRDLTRIVLFPLGSRIDDPSRLEDLAAQFDPMQGESTKQ